MNAIEILSKEADRYASEAQTALRSAAGLLAIAAAALAGVAKESQVALLIAHLGLGAVLVYATQVFTDLLAMGGYRAHLEEGINARLSMNVLGWERVVAPARRGSRRSPDLLGAFFVALYLGLGIVAQVQAWQEVGAAFALAHFALGVFLLIVLWVASGEMSVAQSQAHEVAQEDARPAAADDSNLPMPLDGETALVLVHWKIRRDEDSLSSFRARWARMEPPHPDHYSVEYLSEPLTSDEVGFPCTSFNVSSNVPYTSFYNVAIWRSVGDFRDDVINRFVAGVPDIQPFEFDHRERMVLSPVLSRAGAMATPPGPGLVV